VISREAGIVSQRKEVAVAKTIAVLDACVLFPASIRDTLLYAAQFELYQMQWSWMILAEMSRNLIRQEKITETGSQRLVARMQDVFPDAMIIQDFSPLLVKMMNHPKDRHVLAAAVAAEAHVIVTFNMRDFPAAALVPHNIIAQTPDQFLCQLLSDFPEEMVTVIHTQSSILRKPPKTVNEVLETLRQHAPLFVDQIKKIHQF
jgi:predicted nucleic acid-binding protein